MELSRTEDEVVRLEPEPLPEVVVVVVAESSSSEDDEESKS